MATKVKTDDKKEQKLTPVNFGTEDYVVIELDGKQYAEHKLFADKLIKKGVAKLVKDGKVDAVKSNTTILD